VIANMPPREFPSGGEKRSGANHEAFAPSAPSGRARDDALGRRNRFVPDRIVMATTAPFTLG
jgi:hypothetical protein